MLSKAERPLILVGGGAQDASKEVRELAERLQAPVAAFRMGLGVMDARHPLHAPSFVANQMWPSAEPDRAPRTMKWDSIPVLSRK